MGVSCFLLHILTVALYLLMIVLIMPQCQPLLHELFAAFGVNTDAHRIAWRHGIVAENLPHLVKQSDGRIQKIVGWKPHRTRRCG